MRADFEGSIAGEERAFHALADGDGAGVCGPAQIAKRRVKRMERNTARIMAVSPGS